MSMYEFASIIEAMDVYESSHVLKALNSEVAVELPTLFFQVYTCAICKHNILSSQQAWTFCSIWPEHRGWCHGDLEEEECTKVHYKGYEVPRVTMFMETFDSDDEVKQPPP